MVVIRIKVLLHTKLDSKGRIKYQNRVEVTDSDKSLSSYNIKLIMSIKDFYIEGPRGLKDGSNINIVGLYLKVRRLNLPRNIGQGWK
jgi:hypothetical protein